MLKVRTSLLFLTIAAAIKLSTGAELSSDYYDEVCPEAVSTIRKVVKEAIKNEPRMGASLLRMHFHDCFVNGCDGSVLLDDTANFTGEKTALPNLNSLRGFEVIDKIKAAVNSTCDGNVISCADIVAVAANESVYMLGGPSYAALLGRRDARNASLEDANRDIPRLSSNHSVLLDNFQSQGLDLKDLVLLSGGHTIGLARCTTFRSRIYNDTNINPEFAISMQENCPSTAGDGDNNTASLDTTFTTFDTAYFEGLMRFEGLLPSDQELFKNDSSETDNLVLYYSNNADAFWEDFGVSMINMGNIKPLTGEDGEIRMDCRKVN